MRITRAEKSVLSDWWFTVDRLMFFGLLLLMGAGLVLSLAASPPIAAKFNLEPFYFVRRQAAMLLPGIVIMFAASTLTPKQIRRASLIIFVVGIALMAATMLVGPEIKGAKRWLQVGFFSIQPSEFVKPAFVVLTAWLFNESQKRKDVPGIELALALYGIFALMLVLQPDFGQTLLVTIVWITLFFMAGISLFWIGALGLAGLAGIASAYFLVPHVASRIDRFLNPASGDTYQADKALNSFLHGGWFGRGPGEGTVKDVLPDSHTDFIFAVAAEEYGLIACLILLAVVRLHRAARPVQGIAGAGRIHSLRHRRARHAVRHPDPDQHGGECRTAPRQGHDAALHLLWRLIAPRHGADHGLCPRPDAETADGRSPAAERRD